MKPYKVCTVLWRFTLRRPLILSNSTFMNTFSKTIFSRPASFTSNLNPSLKKKKKILLQVELSTHIYYKNTDHLKQDHYSWTQNLFTTATLGTEESGRHGEMTVVGRFKRESTYGLSVTRCREVGVSGGSTVQQICISVRGSRTNGPLTGSVIKMWTQKSRWNRSR